jgi:hypothetical protein
VVRLLKFAYSGGQQVTAQQANLPPAVTLNVKERRLFSGVFGGEGLADPNVLIIHGRHGLLTWTAVVSKPTGQMSMSIANLGKTSAELGAAQP